MNYKELYETDDDFRKYVDKTLKSYPGLTVDDLLKHKIVQEVGDYYSERNENKED